MRITKAIVEKRMADKPYFSASLHGLPYPCSLAWHSVSSRRRGGEKDDTENNIEEPPRHRHASGATPVRAPRPDEVVESLTVAFAALLDGSHRISAAMLLREKENK